MRKLGTGSFSGAHRERDSLPTSHRRFRWLSTPEEVPVPVSETA
jgi:hypothetical protein